MAAFIHQQAFHLSNLPDLAAKVAVITGGQAGIGQELTAQLLLHGIAKVYILGQSADEYAAAKAEWTGTKKSLEAGGSGERTAFVRCNLADINDVKQAVETLLATTIRIDILINNADLSVEQEHSLSPQGMETIFATNYLGHFVLTNLLLPRIEQTAAAYGDARIVNTSSSFHFVCHDLDLSLLTSSSPVKSPMSLDGCWKYGRSKLANILFTSELARLLRKKGVMNAYVNSFFPGNLPTNTIDNSWQRHLEELGDAVVKNNLDAIGLSPVDAASTALFLATNPRVKEQDMTGKYFVPIAVESKPSHTAQNKDLAKNLWYWSDNKVAETLGKGWRETADLIPDAESAQ